MLFSVQLFTIHRVKIFSHSETLQHFHWNYRYSNFVRIFEAIFNWNWILLFSLTSIFWYQLWFSSVVSICLFTHRIDFMILETREFNHLETREITTHWTVDERKKNYQKFMRNAIEYPLTFGVNKMKYFETKKQIANTRK